MRSILVVDNTGQVRCGSSSTLMKLNLADRPYFQAGMRGDGLMIGEVVISRDTQKLVLPLALPMLDEGGKQVGLVVS